MDEPGVVGESERFDIRRQLGVGGMGIVYEAFDKQRRAAVALKTLKRLDATTLYRFKREFRFLTDVVHPNLVQLYELFSAGDEWFFTMELIDGVSFLDYVRPTGDGASNPTSRASTQSLETEVAPASARRGTIDFARLRPAFVQLARGVAALHRAGRSHRDLKPSNVLVEGSGRVVICDFGLVTEITNPDDTQKQVIGTAAYMSPEQAAGKAVSAATDWYSVGVMLYEALTGRVPFGGSADEILKLKDRVEPLPPSRSIDGVPADLDWLCVELLRREPADRPSGEQVLARLGERVEPLASAAPANAPFVGRGLHLAALHRAYDGARTGRPVTLWVHGRSGAGKTTLVRRFVDDIRARNEAIVLAGRCYERESVPYKAMDSVIDALSGYLRKLPKTDAERIMPRDVQVLARLFPVLRRIQIVAEPQTRSFGALDLQETRRRALAALRELLTRLAAERPVVMWIDDLQWGDLDSAMMLAAVLRAPTPPHLMFVGSYRADDAGGPFLVALKRDCPHTDPDVEVGPLSDDEARELARTIVHDDRSAGVIAHESGGSPFFVHELARYVGGGADLVTTDRVTLDEVLRARLAKVPDDARALLRTIAVAGHALPRSVALDAAGVIDGGNRAMAVLQAEHLVRTRGGRDRDGIETYHDRIRDAVCASLAPEQEREIHARLADALQRSDGRDPQLLLEHLLAAGEHDRAARHAAEAAAQAAEAFAFDRAARLYQIALELESLDEQQRRELTIRLGDALAYAGRGAEAAQAYLSASAGSSDALELRRRAAEQLLCSGHFGDGVGVMREVLAEFGMKIAATPKRAVASILWHRFRLRLRGLRARPRHASEIAPRELARVDALWACTVGLGLIDTVRGEELASRHMLGALELGEPLRMARALAGEAAYLASNLGVHNRRLPKVLALSDELARQTDDPNIIGLASVSRTLAAVAHGRWRDARREAEQAETILRDRCTGVTWELASSRLGGLAAMYYLGEIRETTTRMPALLADADQREDLFTVIGLASWPSNITWLAADDAATARRRLVDAMSRWSWEGFHWQHCTELFAHGQIDLYLGDGTAAWNRVAAAWPALQKSFLLRVRNLRVTAHHLRARAALAVDKPSAEQLASARKSAAILDKEDLPSTLGLARCVQAGLASHRDEAAALLAAAIDAFETGDMASYAAAARRQRGELVGGADGKSLIDSADAFFAREGVQQPARLAAMLVPLRASLNS